MSDSSQVQLYYRPESTWGETPSAVSPQLPLRELRFTNESLNFTAQTAVSNEIRRDRQTADIIRTGVQSGGDVGIEFSFGAFDDLLEGAFYSDWTTEVEGATTDAWSVAGSPQGTVITAGSPNSVQGSLSGFALGSFIEISGSAASPTNDGYYRVVSAGSGTLTVTPALPNIGADTFRLRHSFLRNGTTAKSFLVEKRFSDIDEYISYSGMRVGTVSLNIQPGAILTGSLSFQGKTATAQGDSIINGLVSPQYVEVASNDVFNAIDNIGDVLFDGAADANLNFTEVSFQYQNALRPQPAIGTLANVGIGAGRIAVTGTISAYFVNRTFYEKYLNFETASLSFSVTLDGNTYVVDFPSFKFTGGEVVAQGNDQDVLVQMDFTAKRDPTYGYTVALNRFGTIPSIVA